MAADVAHSRRGHILLKMMLNTSWDSHSEATRDRSVR